MENLNGYPVMHAVAAVLIYDRVTLGEMPARRLQARELPSRSYDRATTLHVIRALRRLSSKQCRKPSFRDII